ncbi:hypothetical protein [Pseudonocardia humida]|uniref:DUF320 domain-containing protein n=1 Tax=Pseudonocardia humida TaxID=2800819 RepID=A0ABT0ZTU4_9PSEU|nr:hypothetical protein [Pseudonocardia humida]MCO1654110.1 hypothetical protein [Pseudonocardia humida]
MLKKAGIVVAVAASGLLIMTPVASARTAPAQASNNCSFAQSGGSVVQTINGVTVVNAVAPITVPVQALNCNSINLSNVVNTNSGNTTSSSVRTRIENSFNRLFILRR